MYKYLLISIFSAYQIILINFIFKKKINNFVFPLHVMRVNITNKFSSILSPLYFNNDSCFLTKFSILYPTKSKPNKNFISYKKPKITKHRH